MSNLSLPSMTHRNLTAMLKPGKVKTLAFETTAYAGADGSVAVAHHGTRIATISAHSIQITNAGWSSQTTRARIHKVLTDNSTGFSLGQKNFEQVLTERGPVTTAHKGFTSATIAHTPDGGWTLTDFNGEAIPTI